MLPAVPLPVVLSQMTSPDVEHLGVAEALPVDASEAVAAIVAADASTAVADSAMVRVACSGRSFGDRVVMFESFAVSRVVSPAHDAPGRYPAGC
ncbi:MAG: hypothetical protein JWN81_1356 [Solirubrobacterales bacterium]|nr:hypothetical protein [Solirubrobacterales bacterium]